MDVHDPVHGFISLRAREVELLNTRALQRLRGIRQLALASLVYPGALHTRFDHTLGVTHVAGGLATELRLGEGKIELVRLAALLHDVGHGPFSHVSEQALERYADRDKLPSGGKREKIHELITAEVVTKDKEIERVLGPGMCDKIARLLGEGYGQDALKSLVSGPLDADKQDYLLRDSLFCGVQYGAFDIHQLHRSLVLAGPPDEKELRIKEDGVHAVEQYVLAKYYLTTNVYRHKVRLITDQMILRAIVLGIEEDDVEELRRLYAYDGSDAFIAEYMQWDDARFLHEFGFRGKKGSHSKKMLDRLRERRLLKRVFSSPVREFSPETRETLKNLVSVHESERRKRVESSVAEVLREVSSESIDPHEVIVHAFSIKSVRETARNDEEEILVEGGREPVPFAKRSTLFASINEQYSDEFVEVYAPLTWSTKTDRKRLQRKAEGPIREALEELGRTTNDGGTS